MATWEGPAPLRLSPRIQHYDWGDASFIPRLLGLRPGKRPCAEAWFGAHSRAPASALLDGAWVPLDGLIARHGEAILGERCQMLFGGLPYLLKVLAVARPLSIQVHADQGRVEEGFLLEETAGVPLDAPHRRYRDGNHKPEMLVALTDLFVLLGFRPPEEISLALDMLPELRALLPSFEPTRSEARDLFAAYFAVPPKRLPAALERLLRRLSRTGAASRDDPRSHEYWMLRAHRDLSRGGAPDPGLALIFFLSLIHLSPGQAVYIPPGAPHAYLRGAGIELMASSDNVLRAGLTGKHVDTEEFLRALALKDGPHVVLGPTFARAGAHAKYHVPAGELGLRVLHLGPGASLSFTAHGPETLLVLSGSRAAAVTVESPRGRLNLGRGGSCLLPNGTKCTIEASRAATVYRAGASILEPRAEAGGAGGPTCEKALGADGRRREEKPGALEPSRSVD